jgi:transposase
MIKNPKLAKHIADASWGEFTRQLKYKANWAGRVYVEIDRFFPSSKRCHKITRRGPPALGGGGIRVLLSLGVV